jgi:hypothetical protein
MLRSTILTLCGQALQAVAWTLELLLIILWVLICLFHIANVISILFSKLFVVQ